MLNGNSKVDLLRCFSLQKFKLGSSLSSVRISPSQGGRLQALCKTTEDHDGFEKGHEHGPEEGTHMGSVYAPPPEALVAPEIKDENISRTEWQQTE